MRFFPPSGVLLITFVFVKSANISTLFCELSSNLLGLGSTVARVPYDLCRLNHVPARKGLLHGYGMMCVFLFVRDRWRWAPRGILIAGGQEMTVGNNAQLLPTDGDRFYRNPCVVILHRRVSSMVGTFLYDGGGLWCDLTDRRKTDCCQSDWI